MVDAFWGYATRIYEPVPDLQKDWKTLFIMNRPPYQPRAGIIQPIEGNRWLVTIAGVMHDYPPTDEKGFLDFARSLSSPELYRAIEHARPLSRICGYRRTANRLRHYDKCGRAAGVRGARRLGLRLQPGLRRGHDAGRPRGAGAAALPARGRRPPRQPPLPEAGREAGRRPWALTTGEDLRWPATQGGKITAKVKFMHWYIEQVIRLIPESPEVFHRFQEVNHMMKSPAALFHPAVLGPVLRQAFGPRRRAMPQAVEAPARARSATESATTSTITVLR